MTTLFEAPPSADAEEHARWKAAAQAVPDFFSLVARRKLKQPDTWRWWSIRRVGDTDDALVRGAVPVGTRKDGSPKFPPKRDSQECVVADVEREAAIREWETATGLCARCGGCGQRAWSWGVEGTKFKPCERCGASGKAGAA